MSGLVRKATVLGQSGGLLALGYHDGGAGIGVARPYLGGLKTGFHSVPAAGDQVLAIYESAANQFPKQALATTDFPASLPTLGVGESAIYHADGRYLKFANGSVTTLLSNLNVGDWNGSLTFDSASADNQGWQMSAGQHLGGVSSSLNIVPGTLTLTSSKGSVVVDPGTATGGVFQVNGQSDFVGGTLSPVLTLAGTFGHSANYGMLSVGDAPFDGFTSGFFAGVAGSGGTLIAGNAASAFAGGLLDLQVAGTSKFSVSAAGNTLVKGTLGVTGDLTLSGNIMDGAAAPATGSKGLVSLGAGPFDGTSAGHFNGLSAGTVLAINAASTFAGRLLDLQQGGVTAFGVQAGAIFLNAHMTLSGGTPRPTISTSLAGGSASISGSDTVGIITITSSSVTVTTGLNICSVTFGTAYTSQPHAFLSLDFNGNTSLGDAYSFHVQYLGSGSNWTGFNLYITGSGSNSTFIGAMIHYLVVQ